MRFVDYRSRSPHFSFMLERDNHKSEVLYVEGENKTIKTPFILLTLYLRFYFSRKNKYFKSLFIESWYKYIDPIPDVDDSQKWCIIITITEILSYNLRFISYLHKKHNCKVIFVLGDIVNTYADKIDFDDIKQKVDLICTYNEIDAHQFDLSLHPAMVFDFSLDHEIPFYEKKIDVVYIGRDKGRGVVISDIYRKYSSLGLKCAFYIVGDDNSTKYDGIKYINWLSYNEVFEIVSNAKCILNILQSGATGITLRENEAYNLGSFLITNNKSFELKEIFNDGQVVNIEDVDSSFVNRLHRRKNSFNKKYNSYSLDSFYHWISSNAWKD